MFGPHIKLQMLSPRTPPSPNSIESTHLTPLMSKRKLNNKIAQKDKKKKKKKSKGFEDYCKDISNAKKHRKIAKKYMYTPQNLNANENYQQFKLAVNHQNFQNVTDGLPSPTFTPISKKKSSNRTISVQKKSVLSKSEFILRQVCRYFRVPLTPKHRPGTLIFFNNLADQDLNVDQNDNRNSSQHIHTSKDLENNEIFAERKKLFDFFIQKLKSGIEKKNYFGIYESLISMYETGNHFFDEIEAEVKLKKGRITDEIIDVILILRPFVENSRSFGNVDLTPRIKDKLKQFQSGNGVRPLASFNKF